MESMARHDSVGKSLIALPKWLVVFIVLSLFFLILGVFFNFPFRAALEKKETTAEILGDAFKLQKEILAKLDNVSNFEQALLAKFDGLSSRVSQAVSFAASNAGARASISNNIVVRLGHIGTRKLCKYSEEELKGILSLMHQCGYKQNRYYYGGAWMTWELLHVEFERNGLSTAEPGCVLGCKYDSDVAYNTSVPHIHAFHLRRNSTDSRVLWQLFERESGEHDFLKPHFNLKAILDAGANIGIASALFAVKYPNAVVVSVEASESNFKILRLNTEPYPNVIPINGAIWPTASELSLIRGPRNPNLPPEWGFMVVETATLTKGEAVEDSLIGVSIPYLLKLFGLPAFDFCKIDIEGSEGKLFGDSNGDYKWADDAKIIALELHGDMVPGSNVIVLNFFEKRPHFQHMKNWSGEYVVYKRNNCDIL